MMLRPRKGSTLVIWLWPAVLGILSAAGLVTALLGDGWWDLASSIALGIVTLVCIWFWLVPIRTMASATRR